MIIGNLKVKILLAALCCFALVLMIPVPSSAQLGGAVKDVGHGIQKGAEKTKEGAEDVGHGAKRVITGDDNDQNKQQTTTTQQNTTTEQQNTTADQNKTTGQNTTRMKPSETPESSSTEQSTTTQTTEKTGRKHMPKTAGELPLLALAGCISLAFAGVTSLKTRSRRSRG
jgi:chromatin remodeling complex protein RSC6